MGSMLLIGHACCAVQTSSRSVMPKARLPIEVGRGAPLSNCPTRQRVILFPHPIVEIQRGTCRIPQTWVNHEQLGHKSLGIVRYSSPVLIVKFVIPVTDARIQVISIVFVERWITPQENKRNNTHWPQIDTGSVCLPFQNFGSNVGRCATLSGQRIEFFTSSC